MNRKAEETEQIMSTVIYLTLAIVFLFGMLVYVNSLKDGASNWEDFYAKEIATTIDLAQPNDQIILYVQPATQIAAKNKITDSQIFSFDNINSQVCVQLTTGTKSCYGYFSNLDVLNSKVEEGVPYDVLIINMGTFK